MRAYTVKLILICDVNIKINLKFITCNINFVCRLKNYTSNASLQEQGVLRLKNKLLKLSIELLGTRCRVSTVAIELTHLPATLPCETCLRLLIVQFVPMKEAGSMSVRKKGRSLRTFTLPLQRLPQWELPSLPCRPRCRCW